MNAAEYLKGEPDEAIRLPLWDYPPHMRKAVIHERKRRFGVDDDEGLDHG